MKTNERFLEALKYINVTVKSDNKLGHQWKYCNVTSKKAKGGFEAKRKAGKYLMNCVDGVQDALRIAKVDALAWYGSNGKIVWCGANAKENAQKYFTIIDAKGKTLNQLYKSWELCDGDILIYQGMNHTNAYYGGTKCFDSGHAYATGNGEGAKIRKTIGAMRYRNCKVGTILRLKDRAHYRVQAGAYSDIEKYHEQITMLRKKKISATMIQEDRMYKVQVGYYSGKTNAERKVAELARKGISAFVKEVP